MALRVLLAGHNVDVNALREVCEVLEHILKDADPRTLEGLGLNETRRLLSDLYRLADECSSRQALTPEVLSAAYARISRDPKSVPELRRAARAGIARARKSNEAIIFGLGHASVAEHATFNFYILGLSRLAAEELQSHRLLSFTEKSQRYITASDEYVVPEELTGGPWESRFRSEVQTLFSEYRSFFEVLLKKIIEDEGESSDRTTRRDQENRAKEDARYLLPLATATQMGVTVNARNLEHVVRECIGHELAEEPLSARESTATAPGFP
jgi:flavin-dependent thymidylate synthase